MAFDMFPYPNPYEPLFNQFGNSLNQDFSEEIRAVMHTGVSKFCVTAMAVCLHLDFDWLCHPEDVKKYCPTKNDSDLLELSIPFFRIWPGRKGKRRGIPSSTKSAILQILDIAEDATQFYCPYGDHWVSIDLLSWDHILAVVHGGTNDLSNLLPVCIGCNQSKGPRHVYVDDAGYHWNLKDGTRKP